ncbi:hypothetical protein HS088_TW08G00564 [Tripterygium wilfordii]|uniref:Uncharacterized protein n=1 Tax=Tripterygium wilfordii TaxID=458696 RepID=A0A7J7DD26_TRIWF|nr:hypothetical protein HS088_TW08G00564 [Tripterygium wilfordii]
MIDSTNSKTRSKASKRGKLMKLVLATFRVIGRANTMYMKSMENVSSGGMLPCPSPQHQHAKLQNTPRSPSVSFGSSKPGMKQTVRGESSGITKIKSYSVGVGKIGKIDEDRACSFRVLDANELVFHPRSRSPAVQKSPTQH